MSLADDLAAVEDERSRAQLENVQADLRKTQAALRVAEAENDRLRQVAEFARPLKPPKFLSPKKRNTDHRAIICTVLSDTHFDEVVNADEIGGLNAYDRSIAEQRLERYFQGVVKLSRDYLSGVSYDGCVLMLGGDIVSGDIHDELAETNEGTTLETVLHWTDRIAAGIELLAAEFGNVHVPVVVGNHGRRSRKPRAKKRARDNFDWLIGQWLARHFAGNDSVSIRVPDSTDCLVDVYDTRFLLTHGDQTGGGGGIGGIWPPLMRMKARKLDRYSASDDSFDWMVLGHFHQLVHAQGLIVNGSLKGYDEYAAVSNFKPERAQQALWIVSPEHGVTFAAPVFCDDREAEGW